MTDLRPEPRNPEPVNTPAAPAAVEPEEGARPDERKGLLDDEHTDKLSIMRTTGLIAFAAGVLLLIAYGLTGRGAMNGAGTTLCSFGLSALGIGQAKSVGRRWTDNKHGAAARPPTVNTSAP